MATFWSADPNISLSDTFSRIEFIKGTTPLFFLLLKYFSKFFQYHPDTSRFFVLILGIAAIPIAFLVSRELKLKKSSVLFGFFICTNIYLINYSQEVKVYVFLFLISFISIFLFLKLINEYKNTKKFYILSSCFFVVNILGFATHPFFLIIIISEISHCLFKITLKKNYFIKIFFISIFSFVFSLLALYDYLSNLALYEVNHWVQSSDYLNIKFFSDFYFRLFFGSKIMGAIYFFTLILLVFAFRKKIFSSNYYMFFIFIIFFSYFVPILYGFIKVPVLANRYIIFVLIPIFTLISALIYELKNTRIKKFVISILVISTLSNLYLEFSNKNYHHKPETKKLLNSIASISDKEYSKNIFINKKGGVPTFFGYVVKLDEIEKNNFQMLDLNQLSSTENFWLICYIDICFMGICYKDLPNDFSADNFGEPYTSCPNLSTGITNEFKLKKVIKKNNPHHKVIGKYYVK
jgi:uncharacterized membrane protein